MGQSGPHLLPVDDPLVAVPHGPAGQASHVGPRPRLAKQLAPDFLTSEHGSQQPVLKFLGGVGEDDRCPHADANRVDVEVVVGDPGGPQLGIHHCLEAPAGQSKTSQPLWELHERQAAVELCTPELDLVHPVGRNFLDQFPGQILDLGFGDVSHGIPRFAASSSRSVANLPPGHRTAATRGHLTHQGSRRAYRNPSRDPM